MKESRRTWLISLVGLPCLLAAGCAALVVRPGPLPANVEKMADGVYLFRAGQQRSLFMVTSEGVIVTDPINAEAAREYRAAIAALTDRPVRFVVYSHYHWDRVSGGKIFRDEGARFVAQERCAERFRANPNPDVVMPDITFSDHHVVALGGRSLELRYFGPSHGDCLTVFLARPANLLQVVELVNPPRASFPDDPSVPYVKPHNLRQFFRSLEAFAAAQGVREIVASSVRTSGDGPGGPQLSPAIGPVALLRDQALFWEAIYKTVEEADAQGKIGMDSFVRPEAIDLTRFSSYDGYDPAALPIIMRRFVGYYDMGR